MQVIKTKPPLKFFCWMLGALMFTGYLFIEGMVIGGALFYGVFGIVLLYWIVSNKDCRITLSDKAIEIVFNRTFWKARVMTLDSINSIEFKKADPFWKLFFINNSVERYYQSQDKLVIGTPDGTEEIMINTNVSDVKMLVNHRQPLISPRQYSF